MEGIKILVCDPIHEDGVNMMENAGIDVIQKINITSSDLLEIVSDYDAIVVRSRTKVTEKILRAGKHLKAVARAGVGLDNIDLEVAKSLGIKVVNSSEAPTNAVAELVLGLMFSLARKIPEADFGMKKGKWNKSKIMGFELKGKTLGIIGFGRIGYQLAKKAKLLQMRVITYDIIIDKLMEFVEDAGAEAVSLRYLLESSDFVTIHVPLVPETKHMIGKSEIEMMKEGAYFINAARGGVVDEVALRDALLDNKLGGAALDVYEEEPPSDTSLIGLDNVISLPHIGAAL